MKVNPYVTFSGNCEEAVRFYEKAFNVTAHIVRYKEAPPENEYQTPTGTENLVMHAQIELDSERIYFCDTQPEYPANAGSNITIMLEFDTVTVAKTVFTALSEGGKVSMELQETFWSKCFGSLTDKFGINWHVSIVESK